MEGSTDGKYHRKLPSSAPSVHLEAVLQSLLQEARPLEATVGARRLPLSSAAGEGRGGEGGEGGEGGAAVPVSSAKGKIMAKKPRERDVKNQPDV